MLDGKALGEQIVAQVREFVGRAVGAVAERVDALEKRAPVPGPAGQKGDQGERGADGAAGRDGVDGKDGAPGENGIHGRDGKDGADGKSAYDLAVAKGYAGTELEWLDSLRGKQGEAGPVGRDGRDGHVGERGEKGDPGRDATQIDYLDGIDEAKSYPRGTHALYRGGVIVAMRATDAVDGDLTKAGWAVAMNGIHADAEESLDDGRTVRRSTTYTNGKTLVSERKTAVMIYRGVWRHDGEYTRGDTATSDGGVWHCEAEKTRDRPGSSPAWRLAVKRGDKGRDAIPQKG